MRKCETELPNINRYEYIRVLYNPSVTTILASAALFQYTPHSAGRTKKQQQRETRQPQANPNLRVHRHSQFEP